MIKKILLWTAAILAVLVVGFVIVVAMQPDDFRVARSATMAAPADRVFAQVNDFHKWDAWSPWIKLDPKAKTTFEGPTAGKGAIFRWSGNDEVGEGSMTIIESKPSELIRLRLEFVKPMQDAADTNFTFEPDGQNTKVSWIMSGKNEDFFSKAVCLVMNMDKVVGSKFEEGLANLKSIVEAEAKDSTNSSAPADETPAESQ
jgi:polyketide cyclase/dehydrase/lipid transport protein